MDIVQLAIKVATDEVDKAQKGLNDLHKNLKDAESAGYKFGYAIGDSIKIATAAFAGLAVGIGTVSVALASHIDDLQDAAEMYGYSATQIAAMKTAAEGAGGSLESVMRASQRANAEVSKGAEAFKNLGISVTNTNGSIKSGSELAGEVAKKYLEGSTTAAQFADVQKVLGKDVDKTAASIAAAAESQSLVNDLQEKGIGIVEGATVAASDFEKANQRAKLVAESAGSILVAKVVPAFTALVTALTDSYVNGGLVRQMFEGLIAIIPNVIDFGGTLAKIFGTAFNVVRAFGQTIGAVGAALVALFSGDFAGAKNIFDSWKQDIDDIDASNNRFKAGVDSVVTSMKAAVAETKNLTIAQQKNGKVGGTGPVPPQISTAKVSDSGIASALLAEEKAIIKLNNEYAALFGIRQRTHEQQVQAEIDEGKYNAKLNEKGELIKKAATEEEKAALITKARLLDELEYRNKITAAQLKSNEVIAAASESAKREVEENRIRIGVLQQYGATQDDVNVALSAYRLQEAETALAIATANGATEEKLIKLREEVALLRERNGVAQQQKTDNDTEAARQRTFQYGWEQAFEKYKKDAGDAAAQGQRLFETATKGMEDAFVQFAMTGKASFSDLAKSIIADLIRIYIQKQITGFIGGLFGGLFGGGGAGAATLSAGTASISTFAAKGGVFNNGIKMYANGGIVSKPTLFGMAGGKLGMAGEAGTEAILPLATTSNGKLGVQAVGGGSSGGVQIGSISITVQGGQTNEETAAALRKELLSTMKEVADGRIADGLRPGGLIRQAA